MERTGIQDACDKMHGQEQLAVALGVTQQAVSKWVKQGYAPIRRIPRITALTGVTARRLCDPHILELTRRK